MLIVAQAINIHLPYIVHPCYKDIKYLETFNIAQTPCTSALAPCHVNRLIVFVQKPFFLQSFFAKFTNYTQNICISQ